MTGTTPPPQVIQKDFTAGHAVVIGISDYRNTNPLPDAVRNDALDLSAVLTSNAYCGYKPGNVHLLLDEDATLANIRTALDALASDAARHDSVIIFFSGHGARLGTSATPESVLLPVEFNPANPGPTSLPEAEFSTRLRQIPARRLLVLIDACHSGGAGSLKHHDQQTPLITGYAEKSLARLAQGVGRVLIASSRADETSLVIPNCRNSVFTSQLLDALRGRAHTNGDGLIRVFDVFNHVSRTVKRAVPGRQHPIFKASDLEDNFPVALDCTGPKSTPLEVPASGSGLEMWATLEKLMSDLYPSGPMDQQLWTRAGGDPSRLHYRDTGRALWTTALRLLRLGGGGVDISRSRLVATALEDYPHHPDLLGLL